MKRILKDLLIGLLIIVIINVIQLGITLFFQNPNIDDLAVRSHYVNMMFLIASIPSGLLLFIITYFRKPKTKMESAQIALLWTFMFLMSYFLIGINNDTLNLIFGQIGFYVLGFAIFLGSFLYSVVYKRPSI
jgi:LytS/YehU family sensor histidine kinase